MKQFLLWLISGLPPSIIMFFGLIVKWLWSKVILLRDARKMNEDAKKTLENYRKLRKEEFDHVALLKCLIEELEDVCVQETIACLKRMRVTSDLATKQVLDSLQQGLWHNIERINNEAVTRQIDHNRKDEQLRDEVLV